MHFFYRYFYRSFEKMGITDPKNIKYFTSNDREILLNHGTVWNGSLGKMIGVSELIHLVRDVESADVKSNPSA